MATTTTTKPVEDTVSMVNNEIAVGADLAFQKKWWRFEFAVWVFFSILIVMDLLGCFGRGYIAGAQIAASDGSMHVQYERIERFGTPSVLRVDFGSALIHEGKLQLWTSESLVNELGAQRVVPQPLESILGHGGILYSFAASAVPASVQFAFQPTRAGIVHLSLRAPGHQEMKIKILVMP